LALGTAFMERADFGMSMVVAPAYLIHLKISKYAPFFSFGMSEYVFQAVLLVILSLVMRKVKKSYFLSFVTAVIYGIVLDLAISVVALIPVEHLVWRAVFYVVGLTACSLGVALLFFTYFPPEAYELFVKELSRKFNKSIAKTKTIYDCCSCACGVILSLFFFGKFVGVEWGTVVCAVVNGWLIGRISRFLENKFTFKDAFPLRNKLN
jgi:uncharacterized membrane protein YczE